MDNIKIITLTAVHIGSGETLQYGNDFVKGEVDGYNMIGIIDARKVMKIIGEEHIPDWVAAIDKKKNTTEIVKVYAPSSSIEDYSKRIISNWDTIRDSDTLKEHIHDGNGHPYIPGSSIKGAIRTAILASIANNMTGLENKIQRGYRDKINAKQIESDLFGDDPMRDVFRFLQVGDAIFGDNYEVAVRMVNINERDRESFWDTSKPQLIEAIGPEDEATFHLKLNTRLYNWGQSKVHKMPDQMSSVEKIFETINGHTKKLIIEEITYWKEREERANARNIDTYIEKMKDILQIAENCDTSTSCIMRIGHGSGWRFITGAWTESLSNFKDVIVPASRPHNDRYQSYNFPKTRRVNTECDLLGFVQLIRQPD